MNDDIEITSWIVSSFQELAQAAHEAVEEIAIYGDNGSFATREVKLVSRDIWEPDA